MRERTEAANMSPQQARWERLLDQDRSPEAFHRALTWAVVTLMHEPDGFWPDGEYRYQHDAEWHARVEGVVGSAIVAATKLMPPENGRSATVEMICLEDDDEGEHVCYLALAHEGEHVWTPFGNGSEGTRA